MNFRISELSAFSNAKLGTSADAIANVGGDGDKIVRKNEYHGFLCAMFRRNPAKEANNAVRTELLRALGRAFGLEGVGNNVNGETTFSAAFMDKLSTLLGADFKRDDFGIGEDGVVKSGKPLTQRRIKAILKRATIVGRSDKSEDYDAKATQVKYDYVIGKTKSLPEDSPIHERLATVKKLMDFVKDELPNLIKGNYMYDPKEPVSEENPAGYLRKTGANGEQSSTPLLKIDNVRAYLAERLGEHFHIIENIIPGKAFAQIGDLEDPSGQITAYVGNVCKAFISASLDLYIDAEAKGMLGKYANALDGVCLEAKTENLMTFKFTYLPGPGEAVALHDKNMSVEKCIGKEIELLIDDLADDEKTWDNVAARVKEKLVGVVRPICTAEVKRDDNDEIVEVKYHPVLDVNNAPVVREITEKDVDDLGEAVMATIIDGA